MNRSRFACGLRFSWRALRRCIRSARVAPGRGPARWSLALLSAGLWITLYTLPVAPVEPGVSRAYVGPGVGIAVAGGVATIAIAVITAFLVILAYPFRLLWRLISGWKRYGKAKVKRAIVIGLDGLEPTLAEELMREGLLPNLRKLADSGAYTRLGTTWPPLSPVAWSSFTTGTNPGKHNIFDFIDRTPHYAPTMSSVRMRETKPRRILGLFPVGPRPEITGLRKSKPFWRLLSENGVFSAIIRVPITYPPDKFHGVQLSAMCAPDLRGTLGLFTFYTDSGTAEDMSVGGEGGEKVLFQRDGKRLTSSLRGPTHPSDPAKGPLQTPFSLEPGGPRGADATLRVDKEIIPLQRGEFSEWTSVRFPLGGGGSISGICRFYLKRFDGACELYCSPIMIDPARPVLPISHPAVYSSYLAARQGPFNTLGLAEDTGALDRHVLDEQAFLDHVYSIHDEREKMLLDALDKVRQGVVTCVFDGPDRIQHMFWRFREDGHPAASDEERARWRNVIREMYIRMDEMIGRIMTHVGKGALFVMSDHGFTSFRRCVDLNAWLRDNGYLTLKDGKTVADGAWLKDVDWSRTRAFALGLAGIFINQKDRESQGIVASGLETNTLATEICEKLSGLVDPQTGDVAVREALPRFRVYKGPYAENAPDIVVGYNHGYRVSWDSATGKCAASVFYDNVKAWSGDHGVHPDLVPGVLFSNWKLTKPDPAIIDLAPTLLELFGVQPPAHMDGKSLLSAAPAPSGSNVRPEPALTS